jgi:transitional endoplasmic reticulum ATPase
VTNNESGMPSPEECASKLFEISGTKFDPDIAADLWPKILQHKWLMSEKLHWDVGLRTASTDFLENMEQAIKEYMTIRERISWLRWELK